MKFILPMAFSDPTHGIEVAKACEEAGWGGVAVSDHVVYPEQCKSTYPYTEDGSMRWVRETPWPDPWVLIPAMAAVTTTLRFYTNIFVLPMRNPFLVAKTVGTAAVVSGNRVTLGIGMGWMEDEFELCEQPFRRRGRRADEMVDVMRKLWTGEVVEHHGAFYDFGPLSMQPAPTERIPLWIGGLSEKALDRVGRIGDGWVSDVHTTVELKEIIAKIQGYRAKHGRADEPLEVFGAAEDAFDLDGFRRLRDAGVTHVGMMPWIFYGGSIDDLGEKVDSIHRFGEDFIAKL